MKLKCFYHSCDLPPNPRLRPDIANPKWWRLFITWLSISNAPARSRRMRASLRSLPARLSRNRPRRRHLRLLGGKNRRWGDTAPRSDTEHNSCTSLPSDGDFFASKLKIFCTLTSINSDACKSCMVLHAENALSETRQRQCWRRLSARMHLHENRCIKRQAWRG